MSDSRRTDVTADWGAAASRSSKTNSEKHGGRGDSAEDRLDLRAKWWSKKNEECVQLKAEWPDRAVRPIPVREGTKLREDASWEKHNGGFRSVSLLSVVRGFLTWYNGNRYSHLVFVDPDGETVRAPMKNSHQPEYGAKYYGKIKTFEREIIDRYDDPHTVMLTFSGSSKNAVGGWRCMADHIREVADSWDVGVYDRLHYALRDYDWEYFSVFEKHENGYGHMHVAVFVDGEVSEADFHSAIDEHLFQCDIAYKDAHDYHSPDPEDRPISINRINPNGESKEDGTQNLGSYIGEYIGAFGEELFDRQLSEIVFRAVCWATGTQVVRFSNGANEMIRESKPKLLDTIESDGERRSRGCG